MIIKNLYKFFLFYWESSLSTLRRERSCFKDIFIIDAYMSFNGLIIVAKIKFSDKIYNKYTLNKP